VYTLTIYKTTLKSTSPANFFFGFSYFFPSEYVAKNATDSNPM